MKFDESIE